MAYTMHPKDPSLRAAFRRIAADQLAGAIDALTDTKPDTLHDNIHSARKSCKKLRALARLVRPGFADYAHVNATLRDAARPLSRLRDAAVFVQTFDKLAAAAPKSIDPDRLLPLRAALVHARSDDPGDIETEVATFRAELGALADQAPHWKLKGKDADILDSGLKKAVKHAQEALAAAAKDPDGERMHEFRKRVKVHWYHARLLAPMWPELIGPHRDVAGTLGDLLGDHHDLVAFDARLEDGDLPETSVRLIRPLLHGRMEVLEREALDTARLLLAEPAGALADRWTAWWKIATG